MRKFSTRTSPCVSRITLRGVDGWRGGFAHDFLSMHMLVLARYGNTIQEYCTVAHFMGLLHLTKNMTLFCACFPPYQQDGRAPQFAGQRRRLQNQGRPCSGAKTFSHAWPDANSHVLARLATRETSCSRTHGHTRALIAPQVWSQTDGWIAMADQYFSKCDPEIAQKINAAFAPIGGQSGLKVRPSDGMEHLCVRCATSATTRPRVNGNG